MDAPINIIVESRDAKAAELVGRAIGQNLRDTYGFEHVMVANIAVDTPGFRAWSGTTGADENPDTLMDAMRDANPNLFKTPVTVVSRETPDVAAAARLAAVNVEEAGLLDEFTVKQPGKPHMSAREAGYTVEQVAARLRYNPWWDSLCG